MEKLVDSAASTTDQKETAELLRVISSTKDGNSIAGQEGLAGLLDALEAGKLGLEEALKGAGGNAKAISSSLGKIFAEARRAATNAAAAESERLLAIRLLGREASDRERDLEEAGSLLEPQNNEELQKAALVALRKQGDKRAGEILLEHWKTCGLGLRQAILNALLSRTQWAELLLQRIEEKVITPSELGTPARQKLISHSSESIRKRAAELLAASSSDRQKVVEAYKGVANLKGDPERGHTLFVQNCSVCHGFRNEGKAVGPDLGTVATKPVQELVVAILDPNQAVDPAYASYSVVTKDDRDLTGILAAETPNSILLRMTGGAEETVLRNNIQEFRNSGRSLMPEGFETSLKPQDMADLVAYILGIQGKN
jgi:putative heme-binding domain-containing protein